MTTMARLAARTLLVVAITALGMGPGGIIAHAAPTTYTIGVDAKTPPGELFQYTDYFPRVGTKVLKGDVVDFKWNTESPDGVHSATLLKTVDTPGPSSAPVIPDPDDGPTQLQENPAADQPSNPSCGTVGSPCSFDGLMELNSGIFDNAPGHDFYVAINAPVGTTVNFKCLLHSAMKGTLSVVGSGASTAQSLDAAAAAQYTADTNDGLKAKAAVSVPAPTTNSDGSKTWYALAGAQGPNTQVLEYFPRNLNIAPGDSVKWTTKVIDPHTVTVPSGDASVAVDYHHPVCEAGLLHPDTPAAEPPAPPCAKPADFEMHSTPFPAGGTTLAGTETVATSGLIVASSPLFPDHYTFKLSGAGNYTYQCKVHDHMTAAVWVVSSVAAPPAADSQSPPPAPVSNLPNTTTSPLPMTAPALGFLSLALVRAWSRRPTL